MADPHRVYIEELDCVIKNVGADSGAWIQRLDGPVPDDCEATSLMDVVYNGNPTWKDKGVLHYLAVVRPRVPPIEVGDTVRRTETLSKGTKITYTYEVLAVHDIYAWVKASAGLLTIRLDELEKVND